MSERSLREELELLKQENQILTGKVVGMTTPKNVKSIIIPHADDFKTSEKISPTIRQDMGVDPLQVFAGRQP